MQPLLNADGSGRLFVNTEGSEWSWEACSPSLTGCTPFASGWDISTGNAAPETVFRVAGRGIEGLSPVWHGNLSIAAPPSVEGRVRANELVTPVLASWRGGWDGDFDQTQLAACTTPAGERCTALTEPKYPYGCRNEAAVIDPAFTGDYLRIADERYGPGTIFTLEARFPFGHEVWQPSGSIAVAMLGQIKPATGPRIAQCGPDPLIEASISKEGIARVECKLGCRAVLLAKHGSRRARVIRWIPQGFSAHTQDPKKMRLSQKDLKRLGPGAALMIVKVDATRMARRVVLFD